MPGFLDGKLSTRHKYNASTSYEQENIPRRTIDHMHCCWLPFDISFQFSLYNRFYKNICVWGVSSVSIIYCYDVTLFVCTYFLVVKKISKSGKDDLLTFRNTIQGMQDETALSLKQNVYKNYAQFIDTAKEISSRLLTFVFQTVVTYAGKNT